MAPQTFHYIKEYNDNAGLATPTARPSKGDWGPGLTFTASESFRITGLTVLFKSDYLGNNDKTIELKFKEGTIDVPRGFASVTFNENSGVKEDGFYAVAVTFPGAEFAKNSTYTLEVVTSGNEISMFSNTEISEIGNGIMSNITAVTHQTGFIPGFTDFEVSVICPIKDVTANEETDLTLCCTPIPDTDKPRITSNPAVVAPLRGQVITEGATEVTMFSSLTDPAYYYSWYKDGIEQDAGFGLIQYKSSDFGSYYVRAVEQIADLDKYSCFQQSDLFSIKERILKASPSYVTVCAGEETNLAVTGATGNIDWTGANTGFLSSTSSSNVTFIADTPGTYTYKVIADVPVGELVTNGDFELGEAGFPVAWTDYKAHTSGSQVGSGTYIIDDHVTYNLPNQVDGWNVWMDCAQDENGDDNGRGQFFINDASSNTSDRVWYQTVAVQPRTEYTFSALFTNISTSQGQWQTNGDTRDRTAPASAPEFAFLINGKEYGGSLITSGNVCDWEEHSTTFITRNETSLELAIINKNGQGSGNDCAVDDISFRTDVEKQYTDVTVQAEDCFRFETSNDTTICSGTSAEISVNTNGVILKWFPDDGFADPKAAVQTVSPTRSTAYRVEVGYPIGNLVENGDFEQGDVKFDSDYSTGTNAGSYMVTNNPNNMNSGWFVSMGDHTTGSGKMYVTDGGSVKDDIIWSTQVDVKKDALYSFSAWVANVQVNFENPAKLSFYANGSLLGEINADTTEKWVNVYQLYEATQSGTITIKLKNEVTAGNGNDFALDDITFSPVNGFQKVKAIRVTVDECRPPAVDTVITLCEDSYQTGRAANQDITIIEADIMNNETGYVLEWFTDSLLTTAFTGANSFTASHGDVYWAKVSEASGGFSQAKVEFNIIELPTISFSDTSAVCAGSLAFQISASPSGGTFSGTAVSPTGLFTPSTDGTFSITYQVTDTNQCTNSDKVSVRVFEKPEVTFGAISNACNYADGIDLSSLISVTGGSTLLNEAYTDASGGMSGSTFNPRSVASGPHSITYMYEDSNGCMDTAQSTITIVDQPDLTFTLTPQACKLDTEITLNASSTKVGTGNYTVSPATVDVSSGTFDPNTAQLETEYKIEYIFTETATSCSDSISQTITVSHATPPTATDESVVIPSTGTAPPIPELTAVGTDLKWYDATTMAHVGSGSPFNTGKTTVGTHQFLVTQTINGCESEPTPVQLQISDCTADKPDATDVHICIGETGATLTATAKGSGQLGWSTVAEFDDTDLTYPPSPYTPSETTTGKYTFYVAEYDATNSCWGLSTPVLFEIHNLPEPTISVDDFFCSDAEAVTINTSVTTSTGDLNNIAETFTINSVASNDKLFTPNFNGDVSGSYDIYYKTVETIDASVGKTCEADITVPVEVEYIAPPVVPTLTTWLTSVPGAPTVEATGDNILWYTKSDLSDIGVSTNPIEIVQTAGVYEYSRYATQTSAKGCTSIASEAKITFVDCDTPEPSADDVEVCENENIPKLSATGDILRWYDAIGSTTPLVSNATTFDHGQTAPDTYIYYVSQEQDLTGQGACEGPRKAVSLTIHPKPIPQITNDAEACLNGSIVTLTGTNAGVNQGSGTWDTYTDLTASGNNANFSPSVQGTHTFTLNWEDANGCKESTTSSITVIEVPQPTPVDDTYFLMVGYGNPMPTLEADNFALGTVNWFEGGVKIGEGASFAGHGKTEANLDNHAFTVQYSQEIVTGETCMGEEATRTLVITDCPVPQPVKVKDESKCFGETSPELEVNEGTWPNGLAAEGALTYRWYQNGVRIASATGPKYTPTDATKGEYIYEVAMYDQGQNQGVGCESPREKITFSILKTDKPTIRVSDAQLCENESLPTFTATGTAIQWYSTDIATTPISNGLTYQATESSTGTHYIYATQTVSGCESPMDDKAFSQYSISPIPDAPEVVVGLQHWGCEGNTPHYLDATSMETIHWYDEFGNTYPTGSTITIDEARVSTNIPSLIYAYAQDASACISDTIETTYEVRSNPLPPEVESSSVCRGATEIEPLRAIGDSLKWYYGMNNYMLDIFEVENQDTLLPSDAVLQTPGDKIYYLTQTVRGCTSQAKELVFQVGETPSPVILGVTAVCPSLTSRPIFAVENFDNNNSYDWVYSGTQEMISPDDAPDSRTIRYEHRYTGIDILRVIETTPLGCSGVFDFKIVASPSPVPSFEYDIYPSKKEMHFYNSTALQMITDTLWTAEEEESIAIVNSYTWNFDREIDGSDKAYQFQTDEQIGDSLYHIGFGPNTGNQIPFKHGYYDVTLTATNQFGCKTKVPFVETLFMDIPSKLFVPSSLVPSHESPLISIFKPAGYNMVTYQLWIYDMWGNTVFYTNHLEDGKPTEAWTGRDKSGSVLPADNYVWKIEAEFENGEQWEGIELDNGKFSTSGNVLLID